MATDSKLRELVINEMTREQYDAHLRDVDPNQIYVISDETEGLTAKDLLGFLEPSPDIVCDLSDSGDKVEIHFDEGATTARGFPTLRELANFVFSQPNREWNGLAYVKTGTDVPSYVIHGFISCPSDPSTEGAALAVKGYACIGNSIHVPVTNAFSIYVDGSRVSNTLNVSAILGKKVYRHCVTIRANGFMVCFVAESDKNIAIDSYQDLSAVCAGKEYPTTGTAIRLLVDGVIANDTLLFADGTEKKLSEFATNMTFHDDVTLV